MALDVDVEALDLLVELRAIDRATGNYDHRVMIPPAASLEAAFRKLRELQTQKIDSYVITQGKHTLGISLGVFSTLAAAHKLQLALAADGNQTEIVEVSRSRREYWIFSGEGSHLLAGDSFMESLELEFPGVGRQPQMCIPGGNTS